MTQEDSTAQETNTTETTPATGMEALAAEQWQQFVSNMAAQNQALANELNQTRNANVAIAQQQRQEQLSKLDPEQRANALQQELDNIRATATQAYQQNISTDVWRRRDAEAAARILKLTNLNVDHPELYRGDWDQNWMPRFVASVEAISGKRTANGSTTTDPKENSANRANVGSSVGNTIPELDPNADGPATIRFALRKLDESRK